MKYKNNRTLQSRINEETEWMAADPGHKSLIDLLHKIADAVRRAGIVISPGYSFLPDSYLLYENGVTSVDPVEWNLPFSRFTRSIHDGAVIPFEAGTGCLEVVRKVLSNSEDETISEIEPGYFGITFHRGKLLKSIQLKIVSYSALDQFQSTICQGWHPLDNDTLQLFRMGKTDGTIFFESEIMREWLKEFEPESMADLVLLNAIYWPGRTELFETIREAKSQASKVTRNKFMDSYGIPIYQEQRLLQMKELAPKGHFIGRTMMAVESMRRRRRKVSDIQWECGKGWWPLIEKVAESIDRFNEAHRAEFIEVTQIKQKSGGLRINHYNTPDDIRLIIDEAVAASWNTCEMCGSTRNVTTDTEGYRRTLCQECRNNIKPRKIMKKNTIYGIFNMDVLEKHKIGKTIWKGVESEHSLQIYTKDTMSPEDLIRVFSLNPHTFRVKFKQAISGDGLEHRRIRTLHSSSLLCLLCFYNISEEFPLEITIEGRQARFTSSRFEIKNNIPNSTRPSNIDVVLEGHYKESDKEVVLFLESKFSEYLSWGKYSGISEMVYKETYDSLKECLQKMELKYENSELTSLTGPTHHYASGIKQMVSHALGVRNAANEDKYKNCDIYLGEILFRFPEEIDSGQKKFNDYTRLYKILADGLNSISDSKFKVISKCLTYQDIFESFKLDEAVRRFYSLPEL